jgi:ABC-2 type transport system permease protein
MTTVDRPRTDLDAGPLMRVRFRHVLRAELGKLTSLRSLRTAMAAVPLLVAAGLLLRAWAYAQTALTTPVGVPGRFAWQDVLTVGVDAGELAVVVLAAVAVGSEYTGRAAISTFLAVPRRLEALAAKWTVVLGAITLLSAVGLVAGTAIAAPFMDSAHLRAVWPATVGDEVSSLVLLLVVAVFALAVSTLTRSTAAGITVVLAVLLVVPVAAGLVGRVLGVDLGPFLLTYAAPMATALQDPAGAGALAGEVAVTVLWLAVPGVLAAVALRRRDV